MLEQEQELCAWCVLLSRAFMVHHVRQCIQHKDQHSGCHSPAGLQVAADRQQSVGLLLAA
jgi:hypothetical protein